jgi:hypothetical protein
MDKQERLSLRKYPYFDGIDYAFWKIRMKVYLQSLGYDVWESVKNGYETPTNPLFDIGAKKLGDNNAKSMNAILEGLSKSEFTKVMHCKSTKEMWDKLKTPMKEMIKSSKKSYKLIGVNLKVEDE